MAPALRVKNELRIIGGNWRGRKIRFPPVPGLRPTPDRVRETLFNWLRQDLEGTVCLDLYAGSGALGFEAASRAAARVVLVERSGDVCAALKQTRALLDARSVEVVQMETGILAIVAIIVALIALVVAAIAAVIE